MHRYARINKNANGWQNSVVEVVSSVIRQLGNLIMVTVGVQAILSASNRYVGCDVAANAAINYRRQKELFLMRVSH